MSGLLDGPTRDALRQQRTLFNLKWPEAIRFAQSREADTAAQRRSVVEVTRNAPQGAASNSNDSRAPDTTRNWRNNYPDWNPPRRWWKNSWKFQVRQRDFERPWRDQATSTWEPGTPHGSRRGREDQHVPGCDATRKRYPTLYPRFDISEELEEETQEGVPAITTITSIRSVKFTVGLPEQEPSSTIIARDDRSQSRSKSPRGQSIHQFDRCRHQERAGINKLRSARTGELQGEKEKTGAYQCEKETSGAYQSETDRRPGACDSEGHRAAGAKQSKERSAGRNQLEETATGAYQKKRVRFCTAQEEENSTTGTNQLAPQHNEDECSIEEEQEVFVFEASDLEEMQQNSPRGDSDSGSERPLVHIGALEIGIPITP